MTTIVAGLVGLFTGLVSTLAFRLSERQQRGPKTPAARPAELDPGIARTLAVLPSAAIVLDRAGTVLRASPAAQAFNLVRSGQIVPERVQTLVGEVAVHGEIHDEEFILPRGPIGSGTIILQLRIAPLGADRILVLADDRTESHRLEEIRRDFVANVSHELKTPVGAISLLSETVLEAADDAETVRRFAHRLQSESARLATLVQEIIELSRLQVVDAFADLSPEPIDPVIAEAVDRVSNAAATRGIDIHVGGASGEWVYGDHDLLVTAVRNLLDNAVHYSPDGTDVGIGVQSRDGLVEIAVVDQGVGIPAADLDRVFERFYRVDAARSRQTGGTGLGLSIVKHIAANHGGEIVVWSQPGKGSTFTLRLPAHKKAES